MDKTVTNLGNAWIPALKVTLGSYADTFNRFFKNLGTSISTPKFISDIQAGAEGARRGLSKIGDSITTSLVPAFGALSRAAGPFLSKLGGEIADIVTQFSNWVLQGEKTGGLKTFFATAGNALHDIFNTGKLVTKIIGQIVGIIVGTENASNGKTPLQGFNDGLQKISNWLGKPENQKKIRDFISDLKDLALTAIEFANKADHVITKLENFKQKISEVVASIDQFKERFRNGLRGLLGLDDANSAGNSAGGSLGDGLFQGLKDKLTGFSISGLLWEGPNSLIGRIKSGLGIASPSTVMMEIGGNLIDGLVQGIGDKLGDLQARAGQIRTTVTNALGNAGTWLYNHGRDAVSGLGSGIRSLYTSLRNTAIGLKNTITNALGTAGSWLLNTGKNVVSGLGTGIRSLSTSLRNTAIGLKNTIVGAVTGAATWLYNTGYNAVVGLWNGIVSLGGWLWNHVVNFVRSNVKNAFNNALGINSPSKVTMGIGRFVTQGLALGMEADASRVEAAAAALSVAALPDILDTHLDLGVAADAAITRSLSVDGSKTLQASWAPGMTGDAILDALRGKIKFSFNGKVDAALGSA